MNTMHFTVKSTEIVYKTIFLYSQRLVYMFESFIMKRLQLSLIVIVKDPIWEKQILVRMKVAIENNGNGSMEETVARKHLEKWMHLGLIARTVTIQGRRVGDKAGCCGHCFPFKKSGKRVSYAALENIHTCLTKQINLNRRISKTWFLL